MSVILMLAMIWWGLLGFLACILSILLFVSTLGKVGQGIFFLIVGLTGQWLMIRHTGAEERGANGFLTAWAAESADWPDGRIKTHEISEFLDCKRLGDINQYLAQRWRLRYHSPVWAAGTETIIAEGDQSSVETEVYVAHVRIHGSEHDQDFKAKLRMWIATDSDEVAKFKFEDVQFD